MVEISMSFVVYDIKQTYSPCKNEKEMQNLPTGCI
jgi:hypothetical protein